MAGEEHHARSEIRARAGTGFATKGRFEIVRLQRRYLPLVALLGAATAALPAIASSETSPTVSAVSSGNYVGFAWSPEQATTPAGGAVTFVNSSSILHGIHWSGGPATPSCSGVPVERSEANWKGTCTFAQPGTYTYYCTVHGPEMHGTITVNSNGTTTTTTTTGTTPSTTPTTAPPPLLESPLAGSASQAVRVAKSQRGGSVKGAINLSKAAAGGRLEIDLFAQSASLAKAKHRVAVRVGRLVRGSLTAGRLSFAVRLDARARAAVRRHRRLTLTVKVILTPVSGKEVTVTRTVIVHA
jgi:plastocyanin